MTPVRKAILLGMVIVGADWLTKFFAVKKHFPSLFFNPDSLLFGLVRLPVFLDSVLVALFLLLFTWGYFKYWYSPKTLNAYVLISAGAAANLVDGVLDGQVVDFINIGISTLNFADFAIMGGIVLLLVKSRK